MASIALFGSLMDWTTGEVRMEPSRPSATPLKTGAGATVAGGGEPPYDGTMEHRITALEARWDAIVPTLATKADVAELRAEMRQSFADVRGELQKMSSDNKSWMLATVLSIIGTMLAAILGISQIYKAAPPPVPIIITLPATVAAAK
jgi:hypothetical protein